MALGGTRCYYLFVPIRGDLSDHHVFKTSILLYQLIDADYFVRIATLAKHLPAAENRNADILINDFERCRKHDTLFIRPPFGRIYDCRLNQSSFHLYLLYYQVKLLQAHEQRK